MREFYLFFETHYKEAIYYSSVSEKVGQGFIRGDVLRYLSEPLMTARFIDTHWYGLIIAGV